MDSKVRLKNNSGLRGELELPADKSILHRAIFLNAVANGVSTVTASSFGRDNFATLRVMRQLGVQIEVSGNQALADLASSEGVVDVEPSESKYCSLKIHGKGFAGLRPPEQELYCGNSGTTARFLTGILAGRPFESRLTGDASLSRRPFKRVTEPLGSMGGRFSGNTLPLTISGGELVGLDYISPIASAQVKSAILLAGLQASGTVSVCEPFLSRDHTERLLSAQGVELQREELSNGNWIVRLPYDGTQIDLQFCNVEVPGDFSHAAFFIVAATIILKSDITLLNVGFNSTRIGLYDILKRMGANVEVRNCRCVGGEEVADLRICSRTLSGVQIAASDVVRAIDEIPILSVAASFASGTTRISGAQDLRAKESDRLSMIASLLRSFSVVVQEHEDGLTIEGNSDLANMETLRHAGAGSQEQLWERCGDHRILMAGAILKLAVSGECSVRDEASIETSFPTFVECLQGVTRRV